MQRPDRILAALTLTGASVCTALFLAAAAYGAFARDLSLRSIELGVAELALGAGVAAAMRLWHANRRQAVSADYLVLCVVALAVAMGGAMFLFDRPLSKIAFEAGWSFRWIGFPTDENGEPYSFTPNHVPLIVFGALIVLVARRGWFAVCRRPRA